MFNNNYFELVTLKYVAIAIALFYTLEMFVCIAQGHSFDYVKCSFVIFMILIAIGIKV